MPRDLQGERSFSNSFNGEIVLGPDEWKRAVFGMNVLRGLIEGIDDFIHHLWQRRWGRSRLLGPVLLGSAMWIDDEELIAKIQELAGACIVVRKQPRGPKKRQQLERLRQLNEQTSGLPIGAFPDLMHLARKVGGKPAIVGPYDRLGEGEMPTYRTLGYRGGFPPVLHAKLALLGHLWWHDEGPLGHVEEVIGFKPDRLWVSSANFTRSSRRNLEFGYWTDESKIMEGAETFLLKLMESSEEPDPDADDLEPDFVPVEMDDEAMAEAAAEMDWDDPEHES